MYLLRNILSAWIEFPANKAVLSDVCSLIKFNISFSACLRETSLLRTASVRPDYNKNQIKINIK